ncbi:MAG: BamA/TamA family outer membrane protein [Acidobacteria bacterium]|nr:BamA/TamA family outer membrane protein [Acidobacteriota bacterium]
MRKLSLIALGCVLVGTPLGAQTPVPAAPTGISQVGDCPPVQVTRPATLPSANSPPLVRYIQLCFPTQGNVSVIESQTYLYYLQTQTSLPSQGKWAPYNEQTVLEDFKRLWATNFLDDLKIDVRDVPFDNGVVGKHITFIMEERQRVKIVDYDGSKQLDLSKIDEKLKEANAIIRLDSFIDPGLVSRAKGVLLALLAEKGYQFASVTPDIKPMPGGPKLVHLTFQISDGPKVKIEDIEFVGNRAISDRALARQMKENKERWFLSFITGRGTYQEAKFEEDADKIIEHYRNKGYVTARVGQPELKYLYDSADAQTRWVQLRVPIEEGNRYRIGDIKFDGNTIVKTEALTEVFKLQQGDWYNEKKIRKGFEKARELYGSVGYFEFTGYPDLRPRDSPAANAAPNGSQPEENESAAETPQDGAAQATATEASSTNAAAQKPEPPRAGGRGRAPLVDITMRLQEGQQYFVNRITFVGNTTTRDNVIRRELRLVENGVFNTEALKFSVRRLNQLGYFKPLEGKDDVQVEKAPNSTNQVDVTLKLSEQNRNQLTFGAGVSQFEGFFGQLAFQTTNFMGRGETFNISMQAGSRAHNYQVSFTEPFLFDRPITGGIDVFKRDIRYIGQFTQKSTGGNLVFGFPVADFSRMFMNYSYERVKVTEINEAFCDPLLLARNPFLRDSLLLGGNTCENAGSRTTTEIDPFTGLPISVSTVSGQGIRTISKIVPSFIHNTIDQPIFPTTGRRYTLSMDLAGPGGNTYFIRPRVEGVWIFQHTRRTSLALRSEVQYIRPMGSTKELPIFEKIFQGGEYSVRGYDIRSIGPRDPATGLVLGGDKSLLFNVEYLITIAGPVRLVAFYDAGQVRDRGERFGWKERIDRQVQTNPLIPLIGLESFTLLDPATFRTDTEINSAFKTSTGLELRFFMPVLNVPFRLIFAYNPQREGVLDNNLLPAKKLTFRFAVGSTF